MRRSTALMVGLLAALLPGLLRAQQEPDWSKIEIKTEKVAGNVYMLYGVGGFAGGNIGVSVGEDGVVLVDDQFEPLVPKIEAALQGITTKPVRFVLIIPGHGKLATRADLQEYLSMLKQSSAIVETGVREGKTLEQLQGEKVLAQFDAQWGGGFIKTDGYIAQLYNSFKGIPKNP